MDGILFETERLYFRALQKEDLDEIMEIWGDEEVMAWSGGAGTIEQEERSLSFYRTMQKERGFSLYLVFLKETEEAVGVCGFNPPVESFDAELLYHFKKRHWGKGYATESVLGVTQYAKDVLHFRSIISSADPKNKASQKVLEKAGYRYIGMKWYEDLSQEEPTYVWESDKTA